MLLRKRILGGYGITLALMSIVLIWAIINLVSLGQASEAILSENYRSILAAENMIDSIERQDSATLLVILGYSEEGFNQFHENESHFLQWLGRAADNITIPGEKDILDSIETGYSKYLKNFSLLRQLQISTPSSDAGEFYHEIVLPSFKQVRDAAVRLRDINQETMFSASKRAESVARTAIWSTTAVFLLSLVGGFVFSLLLSKRLVKPIQQILSATETLAEGNYDVKVPKYGSDELAGLAEGFNTMASKLGHFHRINVRKILSEKRKSEAVLRSIEDGVVVVDSEFRVVNANPLAIRIFQIDNDSLQGKHFLEVVKNEQLFALIKQTAESGKSPIIEEGKNILTIGDDDSSQHYLFSITPVHTEMEEMLGIVLLLRDVTQLKELDKMKSEFVMTASHELKTPIQSLGMSINLLQESFGNKLNEREKQLLDIAEEELSRLKSLVTDLLDLSKIEAGKLELEFGRVSPRLLAEKAVEALKGSADEKQIALSVDMPEKISEVFVDALKITWVLTNLISNAIRYAEKTITLSCRDNGPWVTISVSDDGQGIPLEYQSRIFDKFVRVKNENDVSGTGLGLAICKEIVKAHRGTIWVDSTPGKGSTFSFTLPSEPIKKGDV
jgi:NtrC-family two-component system sensor histidine kinase KinB